MSSSFSAEPSQSKSPTPANLRFQRRTSERAFYEGAFKPGMDYSAINNQDDHVQGGSPWASSPQNSRANFGASANSDVPPNALSQSPYGRSSQEAGSVEHVDRPSTAGSSTLAQSENGDSQHSPYQPQQSGQPYAQEQHYQSQPQYQQQRQYQESPNQRPESQRYHSSRPQQQRPAPQYKLSAKITALERTGRKDSILRFDVYVRCVLSG